MSATVWAKLATEIAKVVGNWQVSKEKARLKYQIEAGQNYVFVNEKDGEFKNITDKRKEKLLVHFRKRLFDSN